MTSQVKLALAVIAEFGLIVGQVAPTSSSDSLIGSNVFDAGTTIAALALLGYILRQLLGGDLVSQKTIEAVVNKAVRETLRDLREMEAGD